MKIASKRPNLEHNCILQESCKSVRRWKTSSRLVKGGHSCVGDCFGISIYDNTKKVTETSLRPVLL